MVINTKHTQPGGLLHSNFQQPRTIFSKLYFASIWKTPPPE